MTAATALTSSVLPSEWGIEELGPFATLTAHALTGLAAAFGYAGIFECARPQVEALLDMTAASFGHEPHKAKAFARAALDDLEAVDFVRFYGAHGKAVVMPVLMHCVREAGVTGSVECLYSALGGLLTVADNLPELVQANLGTGNG